MSGVDDDCTGRLVYFIEDVCFLALDRPMLINIMSQCMGLRTGEIWMNLFEFQKQHEQSS